MGVPGEHRVGPPTAPRHQAARRNARRDAARRVSVARHVGVCVIRNLGRLRAERQRSGVGGARKRHTGLTGEHQHIPLLFAPLQLSQGLDRVPREGHLSRPSALTVRAARPTARPRRRGTFSASCRPRRECGPRPRWPPVRPPESLRAPAVRAAARPCADRYEPTRGRAVRARVRG